MDFNTALNIVTSELTPQPWGYTSPDGMTLTVIPAGLREAPGYAEVIVRITVDKTTAAETGVTTTYMASLLHALATCTEWEHATALDDELTVRPAEDGMALTVTEVHWEDDGRREVTATVPVPEEQRLPLASALRRALDVARGWEGPS